MGEWRSGLRTEETFGLPEELQADPEPPRRGWSHWIVGALIGGAIVLWVAWVAG